MAVNITSIKTSSDGILQGDNPLHFAFPLLLIQTILILCVTRPLALLFKPLRQPKVIAEIVGGILLGPSALGRNQTYLKNVFPKWSQPTLESVANLGLLFFLFLVGLELDLTSIRRGSRQAFAISIAGISLPFAAGAAVAIVLRKKIEGADQAGYAPFVVFMGVAMSITAFPVLARILAELKLLTTRVGETAMTIAAFDDVAAWILLALAVALSGHGGNKSNPLVSLWVLLCGVGFVLIMFFAVKPLMSRVARRCSDGVSEVYINLTLAGVMVSGFLTDFIGIHAIFGAFIFGLIIPKEGELADRLIERIEDFVSGLMLPLFFASSGLKTDITKIRGATAWGLLVLVIATACVGKIVGVFLVSLCCRIKAREAIVLGVLMNTKGLVELIVLNIGKEKKVLNDAMFAIMVLMALFTTFITTPIVMTIYKPSHRNPKRKLQPDSSSNTHSSTLTSSSKEEEFTLLACAHGPGNVPGLINLIESIRGVATKSFLKLYITHLVELTERSSSIRMIQRFRRNGLPFIGSNHGRPQDEVHKLVNSAFKPYAQSGRVLVRPVTAISALSTMHEDVCHIANEKCAMMIILPFHKMWRKDEESGELRVVENLGHEWRGVNKKVLKRAPCSVAVFVDRGFGEVDSQDEVNPVKRVCVLFFGGPDDREALVLGGRMADHPATKVTVIRFKGNQGMENGSNVKLTPSPEKCSDDNYTFSVAAMNRIEETALDDAMVHDFCNKWDGGVEYVEKKASNIEEAMLALGRSGTYSLIVVGKGRFPSSMVAELAERQAEHAELGPIGDILSSSNSGVVSSILVVQQHDLEYIEEVPASAVVNYEAGNHNISSQV